MAKKSLYDYDPSVKFTTPEGRLNMESERSLLAQKQREELEAAMASGRDGYGVDPGAYQVDFEKEFGDPAEKPVPEASPEPVLEHQDVQAAPDEPEQGLEPEAGAFVSEGEVPDVTGQPAEPGEQAKNQDAGIEAGQSAGLGSEAAPKTGNKADDPEAAVDGPGSPQDGDKAPEGEMTQPGDGSAPGAPEAETGPSGRPDQKEYERVREKIEMAQRRAAQIRSAEAQKEYMAQRRDEKGREGVGMISPAQMSYEVTAAMARAQGADSRILAADSAVAKAMEAARRVEDKAKEPEADKGMSYLEAHSLEGKYGR